MEAPVREDLAARPLLWILRHLEALGEVSRARLELIAGSWRRVLDDAERRASMIGSRGSGNEGDRGSGGDRGRRDRDEAIGVAIERAIWRIDRFVPGSTCIHRALAGQRMLLRRRVEARVVVGLRKREELEGHAWIEIGADAPKLRLFVEDGAYDEVSA